MVSIPPVLDPDAKEMVPTLKGATALHLLRERECITAAELAVELGCHPRTARRVLEHLELGRDFAVVYERPYWFLRRTPK